MSLNEVMAGARSCRICEDILEPRPVLRLSPASRILVIGQAPGSKVHASGVPWDDASGDHLLEWLDVDRAAFEDPDQFGILPMGLCYPGRGDNADLPPPPICAQTWHPDLRDQLPDLRLTLLIGTYAQNRNLPGRKKTLTATVRAFREFLPNQFPLPHPSWRSRSWIKKNPWFTTDVLPALRSEVRHALS